MKDMKIRSLFVAAGAALAQAVLPGCAGLWPPRTFADFDVTTQMDLAIQAANAAPLGELPPSPPGSIKIRQISGLVNALERSSTSCALVGGATKGKNGVIRSSIIIVARNEKSGKYELLRNADGTAAAITDDTTAYNRFFNENPEVVLAGSRADSFVTLVRGNDMICSDRLLAWKMRKRTKFLLDPGGMVKI